MKRAVRKVLLIGFPATLIAVVIAIAITEVWVRASWDYRRGTPGFFLSDASIGQRLAGGQFPVVSFQFKVELSVAGSSLVVSSRHSGAPLAGGREWGAPLGAQATPVTSALCRAPSGAVRGQDPPSRSGNDHDMPVAGIP